MSAVSRSLKLPAVFPLAPLASLVLGAVTNFVALHFLRPDLDPLNRPTSEYAAAPYGWLMASTFFSLSLASAGLVAGLYRGLAPAARSLQGLGLLGMWALAPLVAMLCPIDPETAPRTLASQVHAINGPVAFLSLTLGALLTSRQLKRDKPWRALQPPAAFLSLLLVEFFGVPAALTTGLGLAGLAQRLYLLTLVAWTALLAARLRTLPGVRP